MSTSSVAVLRSRTGERSGLLLDQSSGGFSVLIEGRPPGVDELVSVRTARGWSTARVASVEPRDTSFRLGLERLEDLEDPRGIWVGTARRASRWGRPGGSRDWIARLGILLLLGFLAAACVMAAKYPLWWQGFVELGRVVWCEARAWLT